MSEEEKQAIERLSLKAITSSIEALDYPNTIIMKRDLVIVLNLIEKQGKVIHKMAEDIIFMGTNPELTPEILIQKYVEYLEEKDE